MMMAGLHHKQGHFGPPEQKQLVGALAREQPARPSQPSSPLLAREGQMTSVEMKRESVKLVTLAATNFWHREDSSAKKHINIPSPWILS